MAWARPAQYLDHLRSGLQHVLEVVEDEDEPLLAEEVFDALLDREACDLLDPECLRNRRKHETRVGDRRQRDEEGAVGEVLEQVGCRLEREARLAGAARACQREQPNLGSGE